VLERKHTLPDVYALAITFSLLSITAQLVFSELKCMDLRTFLLNSSVLSNGEATSNGNKFCKQAQN